MEHAEASSDTSGWTSFGASVPTEDPEIMALLFSNTSLADESQGWQCFDFHPYQQEQPQPYYGPGEGQNGAYYWPQGCGGGPAPLVPNPETENFYCNFDANVPGDYSAALTMDFFVGDNEKSNAAAQEHPGSLSEEPAGFAGKGGGLKFLELASPTPRKPSGKRRIPVPDSDKALADDEKEPSAALNPKKKSRSTADLQKSGKSNGQARKGQKGAAKAALSEDTGLVRQSSCSDSSEDDSIASQELGDAGASSSAKVAVKTRAGRGSATDPQSLYARKRRERINERLRILQNLVPNGTKVDISTMLEEAVQYVKFLQLQIKLLSSDDLWMYAPIAYNGMDIGLDLKITPPQ